MSKLDQFEEDYGSKWDVLMEIKLAEFQAMPSGGGANESDTHLEQFHESLQLNIDSDSEENHNLTLEPAPPLPNNNDVDDGEEGEV